MSPTDTHPISPVSLAEPGGPATGRPLATAVPPPSRTVGRGLRHRFGRRRRHTLEAVLLSVAVGASAAGVVLRFVTHSSLWLDEALTVNVSRLPVGQLLAALRHDGSPPAYYLLLHVWMKVFGTSTSAVRLLPALLSVVTLPVVWALGKEIGGRYAGVALGVLVATSPFAIRYGSESRMYALIMLLAAAGGLALVRTLRDPTPARLVTLGLSTGLLLLTHYWALYLVAATGAVVLVGSCVGTNKTASRFALAAMGSGSLLFLPWAPSFVFQAVHTGTPWAARPSPFMFVQAVGQFAGWDAGMGLALFALYCALFACLLLLVVFSTVPVARRAAAWVGLRTQVPGERWAAPAAAVAIGSLALAFGGAMLSGGAFAYRYASIVLPVTLLLAGLGAAAVGVTHGGRGLQAAFLAACALLGTPVGAAEGLAGRTQASVVASRIRAVAHAGDVIAYCPDQLGPAVSRLLPNRYLQVTFPRFEPPELVNWVDYAKVNAAAPAPGLFARELDNLAGPAHQVWLVWEAGYRTFGSDCEQLRDSLVAIRPNFTEPVRSRPGQYYEHESLERFAPS